jgi:chorismate synthase
MKNKYGENFKIEIFGASHAPEIGVIIEGIPAGTRIDMESLQRFLDRRAPGRDEFSTPRKEPDQPEFVCGVNDGIADGGTVKAVIRNTNVRSRDYENSVPRPGHADYPAAVKFGPDYSFAGGGPFSGRMTAPLCIAGGIAKQLLAVRGVSVSAKPVRIGGETDAEKMKAAILAAKAEGDSVGGIIECRVTGLPVGVGDHMFQGMENRIAQAVFAIPAVKGIEFGAGFAAADMKGSENNDAYGIQAGKVRALTNNAGGILGGMTNGEPVVFRVAMKPTPSIFKPQRSVDLKTLEEVEFTVRGRHDPCVVPRAVPCVEAAAAAAVYDAVAETERKERAR